MQGLLALVLELKFRLCICHSNMKAESIDASFIMPLVPKALQTHTCLACHGSQTRQSLTIPSPDHPKPYNYRQAVHGDTSERAPTPRTKSLLRPNRPPAGLTTSSVHISSTGSLSSVACAIPVARYPLRTQLSEDKIQNLRNQWQPQLQGMILGSSRTLNIGF